MDKKGNIFYGIALSLFLWIMGILTIPFIISVIDPTRIDLSCSLTTITFGTKIICLGIDVIIPYLIWTLVCIILGIMIGKD